MKYFFAVLVWFCFGFVQAQPPTQSSIDSLKQRLVVQSSEQSPVYLALVQQLFHQYARFGQNEDSLIFYLNRASEAAQTENNPKISAKVQLFKAKMLTKQGIHSHSIQLIKKAQLHFKSSGDSLYLSKGDLQIAMNYLDLGMFNKSVQCMERAYLRSNTSNDTLFLAYLYANLGYVFSHLEAYPKSRSFYQQVLSLLPEKDSLKIAGTYYDLGYTFSMEQQFDSAYVCFQQALVYWSAKHYADGISMTYESIADLFNDQQQYDRAIDYLLKSEAFLYPSTDMDTRAVLQLKIAENYLRLKNIPRADEYINRVAKAATSSSFKLRPQLDYLRALRYELLGDFKKAFHHQKLFLTHRDSLDKVESKADARSAERRFEFLEESKLLEVEALALDAMEKEQALTRAQQRLYWIIAAAVVLLLVIVFLMVLNQKNREKALLSKHLSVSKATNEELAKEIDQKRRKLSTHTLQLLEKNKKLDVIKKELTDLRKGTSNEQQENKIRSLENTISQAQHSDQNWEEFQLYFEEVHSGFFKNLQAKHTNLTARELRLSAFLRLNLTTKEIANLLNLPPKSVEVARYRLRKKLELSKEDHLHKYMQSFS